MLQKVEGIAGQPHRWCEQICHWARGGRVQWRYATRKEEHLQVRHEYSEWKDCDYANAGMPNWGIVNWSFVMANVLLTICALVVLFAIFMLVRVQVVHRVRGQRIDWIFSQANWMYLKMDENGLDYDRMMWMFDKWKYDDFYPD